MSALIKMKHPVDVKRYIYHSHGICPSEIHFKINTGRLEELRFVGGGCPGNALLVARLLDGKPIEEVLDILAGIDCRNGTSCPDQLMAAIRLVKSGRLNPAESYRIENDISPRCRIGLIGNIEGSPRILKKLIQNMQADNIDIVYSCGNLTGNSLQNKAVIRAFQKQNMLAIQGERDWLYAHGKEDRSMPALEQKERDWLIRLPHVLSFQLDNKRGIVFYGDYLETFPDFSDFDPFALEMNMVCRLTDFMQDETVFPALEAMIPQFQADIIVFGQLNRWNHWCIAGKDFISVGPALKNDHLTWAVLEIHDATIDFKIKFA
jgi:uncharacterized protein (TIGR03905 family)